MAFAVNDLPEPLSPTTQSVSPAFKVRLTSSIANVLSAHSGNKTDKSFIVSKGFVIASLLIEDLMHHLNLRQQDL